MGKATVKGPDQTLNNTKVKGKGDQPKVFSVVDLRAFVKPDLDEELSDSAAGGAPPGVEMVCECVPVEQCVCNTVTHYQGRGTCPGHACDCVCQCTCTGILYWFPY